MKPLRHILLLFLICFGSHELYCSPLQFLTVETTEGIYHSTINEDSIFSVSFFVRESEEVVSIKGHLSELCLDFELLPSAEYVLLDTTQVEGTDFFIRLKFRDVIANRFLKLIFE